MRRQAFRPSLYEFEPRIAPSGSIWDSLFPFGHHHHSSPVAARGAVHGHPLAHAHPRHLADAPVAPKHPA